MYNYLFKINVEKLRIIIQCIQSIQDVFRHTLRVIYPIYKIDKELKTCELQAAYVKNVIQTFNTLEVNKIALIRNESQDVGGSICRGAATSSAALYARSRPSTRRLQLLSVCVGSYYTQVREPTSAKQLRMVQYQPKRRDPLITH